MNKIIRKEQFSEKVYRFDIEAPLIAKSRKAGNFVIVRVGDKGERMPLTIADADTTKGTITLVVQKVGLSSIKLCNLNEGEYVTDVVGPHSCAKSGWKPCTIRIGRTFERPYYIRRRSEAEL